MRTIILVLCLVLSLSGSIYGQEKTKEKSPPPFVLYYAAVDHVLKHDQGCLKQLFDSPQRQNISDFWYGYIMIKCFDYFSKQSERISKQYTGKNGEMPSKQATEEIEKLRQQCATAVIFDNWDRINSTIVKNPETDCVEKLK